MAERSFSSRNEPEEREEEKTEHFLKLIHPIYFARFTQWNEKKKNRKHKSREENKNYN